MVTLKTVSQALAFWLALVFLVLPAGCAPSDQQEQAASGSLNQAAPETLGQAGRIEGVTPAALALLLAWVKKKGARATG